MEASPIKSDSGPKYTVDKEGHFYCDGIKCADWQLTEGEIRQYVPKEFWSRYFKAIGKKPPVQDQK